jgi:hypothetical protein
LARVLGGKEIMEKYKHLFETYDEGDGSEFVLNTIFKGLTSKSNLSTADDCKNSLSVLNIMKSALDVADVGVQTKSHWSSKLNLGVATVSDIQSSLSI